MTAVPDFGIALPELVFGALTLILLLIGTFGRDKSTGLVSALSVLACIVGIVLVVAADSGSRAVGFEQLFVAGLNISEQQI